MKKSYRSFICTENLKTGKVVYYIIVADTPRRISKRGFDLCVTESAGLAFSSSERNKTHNRKYLTYEYDVPEKVLN